MAKRYMMGILAQGDAIGVSVNPQASELGDWIKFEDYENLKAEVARLRGRLTANVEGCLDAMEDRDLAKQSLARAVKLLRGIHFDKTCDCDSCQFLKQQGEK